MNHQAKSAACGFHHPTIWTTRLTHLMVVIIISLLSAGSALANFARVGGLTLNAGENLSRTAVIDTAAGFAYFGLLTSPGTIVKVRLSDFTRVGTLVLNSGEANLNSAVIDPVAGFAYFGTQGAPGQVVKVRLSDFTRVGVLSLASGQNTLASAAIDTAGGFAYFGTDTSPGVVAKVRLSDFTLVGTLTLNAGESRLQSGTIDPAGGFLYLNTYTSPGKVVKVRLSDFTRVGALSLNAGEDQPLCAAIDLAGGFEYVGTSNNPGIVVKIRLSDFTRVGALNFQFNEAFLSCAVIDPATGFAYFGASTTPGRIIKVQLSDFTRVGAIAGNGGENLFGAAVIDPAGGAAYFATETSPSTVVKVDISPSPATPTLQFSAANYSVQEDLGALTITVTRTGDTSGTSSVDYATQDGVATQKGDFEYATGRLTFAPGATSKTFQVLINEDNYTEGNETFGLTLSSVTGASLGAQNTAAITINDDIGEPFLNPIDDAQSFVYTHYHDFLGREPDLAGLQFWTNQITACGTDQVCIDRNRADVSAAFYLSIEFQSTGYLVYRTYKAAYGNLAGAPVPLHYNEFVHDTHEIGLGVVVNQPGWDVVLENNKQAFMADFVQRPGFTAAYPATMTPTQFVDALTTNAGLTPTPTDRQAAINEFSGNPMSGDTMARAHALRDVAENSTLAQQEFNRAFVLMQYFGYLRRDPNAAPESSLDFTGYNFWLNKLNQFNGNYANADMVKAFITSGEYRQRFGQ